MKNITSILLMTTISSILYGQQSTLQHFDPQTITPVVESYPGTVGYYTGNNNYGDEEFAEKYEIQGSGKLIGISAIHLGQEGTSGTVGASYRAYSVSSSGLPENILASKNISYSDVPVNGQLNTVLFATPANIAGQFFVSFRLGDYSHGGLGTKRLAIAHSPNGTRAESDLNVFARNVVRFHSHGAAIWKDYRTENFSDYEPAIHLALFPVVELSSMAVVDLGGKSNVGALYPNPSSGPFTVPITSNAGGKTSITVLDFSGRLVAEKQTALSSGKNNVKFTGDLQSGTYLVVIRTPEGTISQKLFVK